MDLTAHGTLVKWSFNFYTPNIRDPLSVTSWVDFAMCICFSVILYTCELVAQFVRYDDHFVDILSTKSCMVGTADIGPLLKYK